MGGAFFTGPPMILTRLHARYSRESLGEDLIFKAAKPISGGREVRGANGELEHGASPADVDNFQGRYAIRHPWVGPITCKEPRRGIWGGPPIWQAGNTSPLPATKTAFAPRDKVQVEAVVMKDVPEIDVKASGVAKVQGVAPGPSAMPGATGDGGADGPSKKTGCGGCTTSAPREPLLPSLLALAVGGLVVRARRRRR